MIYLFLLRSGEADGGSTCCGVSAQQGDGSDLVVQSVEALGGAVLGGELQDVLCGLVSILRQGQNDVLAVCQALTGQVLTLVLRAGNIQVQLGNGGTGGVVHGVLSGLDSSLRACSLGRSSNRGSHGRGGGRSSDRGRGRTAGGHADGQCQSSSDDSSIFQFHSDRFSLLNMKSSFMGQLRLKVAHEKLLYTFQFEMQEKILYKSVKSKMNFVVFEIIDYNKM